MATRKKAATRPDGAHDEGIFLAQHRCRQERYAGWKILERFTSLDAALKYIEGQPDHATHEYQVRIAAGHPTS